VQFALTVPTIRDRVVQTALRMVLEPIFERDFAAHSYGFRPNRGCNLFSEAWLARNFSG
jgi:retron-type reverse transcriptase